VVATSPQFFAAVGGWLLSALRGLPFVFEVRDLWPDSIVAVGAMRRSLALRSLEKLELFLYRRAAAVVVLTSAFRDNLLSRGVPDAKIHVILSGFDLSRYAPLARDGATAAQFGLSPGDFVIGYLGTFGMAHALRNVLDAAELVAGTPIKFLLAGTGKEREQLVAEAQRRGLGNVIFIPPQPKEDMPRIWSLCDISLVHLRNAPLFGTVIPSKIFESMGMGLPILLAAPEGEASRIVEEQGSGICVPAEAPQALASAASLLQLDRALREKLGRNSLAAAPRFSREKKSEEMLHVLEESRTSA
jgi:glycosyltransferase involved in cell wall biosynthesis